MSDQGATVYISSLSLLGIAWDRYSIFLLLIRKIVVRENFQIHGFGCETGTEK